MKAPSAYDPSFIHSPLDHKAKSIRLIRLMPRSSPTDPIRCELVIDELRPDLEFHALSYVWGPETHNEILINGLSFDVRDNLYHFLQEKSFDHDFCHHKHFWIDAICIDQSNIQERNHQVNQMAQIYSSARRVHIWLGKKTESSDDVMNDVKAYESPLKAQAQGGRLPADADYTESIDMCLRCFAYISENQYWKRLWIIQEILMAKSISVMYGSRTVPWSQLDILLHDIQGPYTKLNFMVNLSVSNLGRLLQQKQNIFPKVSNDWSVIITLSQKSLCTDIRDRVFGVQGLIDPPFRISVDYSLSAERIFHEVLSVYALHLCDTHRSIIFPRPLDSKDIAFMDLFKFAKTLVHSLECFHLADKLERIVEKEEQDQVMSSVHRTEVKR